MDTSYYQPTVQIVPGGPRLTLLDYDQLAYLVNGRFELEWWNEAAETAFLDPGRRVANEMGGAQPLPHLLRGAPLP